ncbi:MAG: electron transfer flavoprotein subunit alpha/FixB family protein [Lutibacter sp.]
MSVLVYAESFDGKFKKPAFEATSYGKKVAEKMGTNLVVLTINANDSNELYTYGAEKVIAVNHESLAIFNAKKLASVVKQVAEKEQSNLVIFEANTNGLYTAPMVAIQLNAGYASNVVALPSNTNPFTVKRKTFSNKAFNQTEILTDNKVITLAKNSVGVQEIPVAGSIENFDPTIADCTITSENIEKASGKISIADADIVVSGGRGLKGPENWGMIEELAEVLGAATACSKPVSDMGWRPHSEHVGQTGKPVASNLYLAVGISGAIQHLAGVNSSKVKVVINNDPEAPFFKAADYGIVGDAFEVVPKLIEKLKEFKANNA